MKGEKTGEREVTFTFDVTGNRELPLIVGELNVWPKHWWAGKDANGKPRDITKKTLGAAARLRTVSASKTSVPANGSPSSAWPDYWGKDVPARVGENNFDAIEFQYYGDTSVSMEAFKAGQYDFKREGSAKTWATAYDFPR